MKCPHCGKIMTMDERRNVSMKICYHCGYIEDRETLAAQGNITNFAHSKSLNINELAAFLALGLEKETETVFSWLQAVCED